MQIQIDKLEPNKIASFGDLIQITSEIYLVVNDRTKNESRLVNIVSNALVGNESAVMEKFKQGEYILVARERDYFLSRS
jgi:hypothetical protein